MMDELFDAMLQDRIMKIQVMDSQHNLSGKAYLSYSGGKDSNVVHYLLDMALPGNQIPRVYLDTGIEYKSVREFVLGQAEKDHRFKLVRPSKNIKDMLEKYGYPFKSKEHSNKLHIYQNSGMTKTVEKYLSEGVYSCPDKLRYQFTPEFKLKVHDMCCRQLKKQPAHTWETENGKSIIITGMRKSEGGQRASGKQCSVFRSRDDGQDRTGTLKKFHPVYYVPNDFMDMFVSRFGVKLPDLYYAPYNFTRTGCKGCPFNTKLGKDLETLEKFFPAERKQCEIVWGPVYDEYRRLHYRGM